MFRLLKVCKANTAEEYKEDKMKFELPKLDYEYNALEPYIDEKTMTIHHSKHHQAYCDNFNKALENEGLKEFEDMDAEDIIVNINKIPETSRNAIRNHGGGFINHNFFWKIMTPNSGGEPKGELFNAITAKFGSFDKFKEQFNNAAMTRFGSGWAWLVLNNGELEIISTANQDSPLSDGKIPLLCIDVWEHAYYLTYQNKRADYINAFWNVVNWKYVEKLYADSLE